MIDKDTPYVSLTYTHTSPKSVPSFPLPEGYEFVFYREGDEKAWAEIEMDVGQFDTLEEGLTAFHREFSEHPRLDPRDRMLFVKAPDGAYVATCTLWDGEFLGETRQRLHWLAITDAAAGKGIAKALFSRLIALYSELGYTDDFIYLLTASRYYPAIRIYRKLGFTEYRGPRSLSKKLSDEEFVRQTEEGIRIVDQMLSK